MPDMPCAVACISVAEEATVPTMPPIACSKRAARLSMALRRSSSARAFIASCSPRSRAVSSMLSLKTCTASAMRPSSSRRSIPAIAVAVSPPDRRFIVAVSASTGRDMLRPTSSATTTAPISMASMPRMRLRRAVAAAASKALVSLANSRTATGAPAKFLMAAR